MLPKRRIVYCELCGSPISIEHSKKAIVDGVPLNLCSACYNKIMKGKKTVTESLSGPSKQKLRPKVSSSVTTRKPKKALYSELLYSQYEVIEDYAQIIKRAREKFGWSTKTLAELVKESENTIKRIEAGRLVPSIDLAKRLEEILKVKLLVPIVEEESGSYMVGTRFKEVTLGEVVNIKVKKYEGKEQ